MIYTYKGYDKQGKKVHSQIVAQSLEEAKSNLQYQGILVESIRQKISWFTPKIKPLQLASICRNLSIYLKSSIPLYKALDLLQESYSKDKKMTLWLQTMAKELGSGSSFYEALKNQTIFKIPEYFLYSVNMAEKSSNLTNTLIDLGEFISGVERLKQEVTKAFIYPGFIMLIAIVIVNFMLTSIVPNIVGIFDSMDTQLPASTKITLQISYFFQEWGVVFFGFLVLVMVGIGFWLSLKGKFRYFVDKTLLQIPLIKTILLNFELGRFCRVSSLLLKSGVPFAQTLHFSSGIFTNLALKRMFENVSNKVIEGKPFFEAVKSQDEIKVPADFLSAVAIGEKSSELAFTLETLSGFYETNNKDKISILLSLLEPILMIFIGGVIGFLVVSMLLPIFSISIQ